MGLKIIQIAQYLILTFNRPTIAQYQETLTRLAAAILIPTRPTTRNPIERRVARELASSFLASKELSCSWRTMATAKSVKDVSPHEFVKAYSAHLKRSGKVFCCTWSKHKIISMVFGFFHFRSVVLVIDKLGLCESRFWLL